MRLKARDSPATSSSVRDLRHPHREVAAAHPLGGLDQPADRAGDLVRHHQPDQHRRRQHQQRHQGEDQREGDLQPGAVLVQPVVFGDRLLGRAHVRRGSAGSTGRPIISISGGVEFSCTTARTRVAVVGVRAPPRRRCAPARSPSAAAGRRRARRTARPRPSPARSPARRSPPRSGRAARSAWPALRRRPLGRSAEELPGPRQVVGHAPARRRGCCCGAPPGSRGRPAATLVQRGADRVVEPGLDAEMEEQRRRTRRPRWSASTATPLNSSTSRTCSREPAEPRRRSTQPGSAARPAPRPAAAARTGWPAPAPTHDSGIRPCGAPPRQQDEGGDAEPQRQRPPAPA